MTKSMSGAVTGMVSFGLTVHVPGSSSYISASYSHRTFDDARANGNIVTPCLVAMDTPDDQGGFMTYTMGGQSAQLPFTMFHFLLYAPVAGTASYAHESDTVRAWADEYYKALALLPFFTASSSPSVDYVPKVTHSYRKFKLDDNRLYHCVQFTHDLRINL